MDIKNRVSKVQQYLAGIGSAVSTVQAHEVVARALGFKNKHSMAAAKEPSVPKAPAIAQPLTLCIQAEASAGYQTDRGATGVSLVLTQAVVQRIMDAQALCRGPNAFEHVCLKLNPSNWAVTGASDDDTVDEDTVISMYWTGLLVSEHEMWFEGWAEDSDLDTKSYRVGVDELLFWVKDAVRPALNAKAPTSIYGQGFTRQGQVLFATTDPDTVEALATDLAPEVLSWVQASAA